MIAQIPNAPKLTTYILAYCFQTFFITLKI